VSRSPGTFWTLQSTRPVSSWKRPAGTVQGAVDLPGRAAQIGASSAPRAALVAASAIAPAIKVNPRIRAVCLAKAVSSSEQPAIHTASLCVKFSRGA